MSGEGVLPNDPYAVLIDLENGTVLQFTGPAAQLLRSPSYGEFLIPSDQEPDVND